MYSKKALPWMEESGTADIINTIVIHKSISVAFGSDHIWSRRGMALEALWLIKTPPTSVDTYTRMCGELLGH